MFVHYWRPADRPTEQPFINTNCFIKNEMREEMVRVNEKINNIENLLNKFIASVQEPRQQVPLFSKEEGR